MHFRETITVTQTFGLAAEVVESLLLRVEMVGGAEPEILEIL